MQIQNNLQSYDSKTYRNKGVEILSKIRDYFISSINGLESHIYINYELPEPITKFDIKKQTLKTYQTLTICVANNMVYDSDNVYKQMSNAFLSVNGELLNMKYLSSNDSNYDSAIEEIRAIITNWLEIKAEFDKEHEKLISKLTMDMDIAEKFNLNGTPLVKKEINILEQQELEL